MAHPVLPDPPGADEPFYIGYDPPMPRPLARHVTRAVAVIAAVSLIGAGGLALRHRAIAGGLFEFGTVRPVAGIVVERPYPAIRPTDGGPATLLVAPGKHGAASLVTGLDGRYVTIQGQRIARDGRAMLEVHRVGPGDEPAVAPAAPAAMPAGVEVTLRGEIVDSKCFLGVMAPGQGKTHRACASLCLRGGIPPALFVEDTGGTSRLVLLVSPAGRALAPEMVADHAFEPTEMSGRLERADGWWRLRTDPMRWRRLR